MTTIDAQEAQERLDELLAAVESDGRVTISRDGEPVAELVPHGATPVLRLGAYAVVVEAGRILLVHQGGSGTWSLPGGGVRPGEPPVAAAVRELREETHMQGVAGAVVAVHDNLYDPGDGVVRHGVRLLFAVTVEGEAIVPPGDEIDEVRWWPLDALPATARPWVVVAAEALGRA